MVDLADLIARMRLFGLSNPETNVAPEGDPANWAGIAAQLQGVGSSPEAYAQLQQAAQNAIMAQGGYMPQTVDPTLAQTDPTAANLLLRQNIMNQIQQMLTGQQQAYDAASQQVAQQYQQLTQPINDENSGYLQQLWAGLGIDPNTDPNAAAMLETLAQGTQTAGLNQATDQAWFDKMKANNLITTQGLLQGIADGSIPVGPEVPAADSGGGGGGGGGRGRRGYGGGGGSGKSGWSDPKTTDKVTEAAAADSAFQFPGFRDAFLGVATTPEEWETARRIAATYGGLPYNVNKGLASVELPNAEAAIDTATAQQAQRAAYMQVLQQGGRYTKTKNEQSELNQRAADFAALKPGATPLSPGEIERQKALKTVTDPLWQAPVKDAIAAFFGGMPLMGGSKQAVQNNQLRKGNDWEKAYYAQEELDKAELAAAQRPYSESNPTGQGKDFTYQNWGGFVEPVSPEDLADKQAHLDLLRRLAPIAEEFDPNANWQTTKYTQKDSSNTSTSQSSKDPANQLFNNNTDPGYVPYSEDDPSFSGGLGFGYGRGLSATAQRIVARRVEQDKKRREAAATLNPVDDVVAFADRVLNPAGEKKVDNYKRPAAKKAAPKPKPTNIKEAVSFVNPFASSTPKMTPTLSKAAKKKVSKSIKSFW